MLISGLGAVLELFGLCVLFYCVLVSRYVLVKASLYGLVVVRRVNLLRMLLVLIGLVNINWICRTECCSVGAGVPFRGKVVVWRRL